MEYNGPHVKVSLEPQECTCKLNYLHTTFSYTSSYVNEIIFLLLFLLSSLFPYLSPFQLFLIVSNSLFSSTVKLVFVCFYFSNGDRSLISQEHL